MYEPGGYPPQNPQEPYPQPYDPYSQYVYPSAYPQEGNGGYPSQGSDGWYVPGVPLSEPVKPLPPQQKPRTNKRPQKGGTGAGGGGGGRKTSPGGSHGKKASKKKRRSFTGMLVKLLVFALMLAGAAAGLYLWNITTDIKPYETIFLDNIYVDGINLTGMTRAEGEDAVWTQAREKQIGWYVRLKNSAGESYDITAETLGIVFDPSAALQEAWAVGHATSERRTILEIKEEVDRMKVDRQDFYSAQAQQSANTAPIDSILQSIERDAYVAPQNAQILGFYPEDRLNPFSYQTEKLGYRLDTTAIRQQILDMVHNLQSGEIMIQREPVQPDVVVADLEKTVAMRAIAVTPIASNSSEDRNNNIRVAFSKINGLILENGKKFSFNTVVGKRSEKNGFFPAFEYNYGELEIGVGGGVCQASTTVFLAAVQAGMKIEKLKPHSTPVGYTELGKDATVSDTKGHEIDFVFRNNSGSPIYIIANVIADPSNKKRLQCEVRIYGQALENVRYELEAVEVERIEQPTEIEYREDKEARYVTYTDEKQTVIKASEGWKIESYLCTVVDGVQTQRELLAKIEYPARRERVYVGVTPREGQ